MIFLFNWFRLYTRNRKSKLSWSIDFLFFLLIFFVIIKTNSCCFKHFYLVWRLCTVSNFLLSALQSPYKIIFLNFFFIILLIWIWFNKKTVLSKKITNLCFLSFFYLIITRSSWFFRRCITLSFKIVLKRSLKTVIWYQNIIRMKLIIFFKSILAM